MSSLFSSLPCCWFWLLAGLILGWLLNRLLCKCCCKATPVAVQHKHTLDAAAKMADMPTPAAAAPKAAATAAVVIDLAAAKAAGFSLKNANDLTVVEGIGPKINELFHNAGIKTFAQLAAASVPQMRKILDDGGSRFRIANPGTWEQQATLAAANKWKELKKLQDDLSGGIKK